MEMDSERKDVVTIQGRVCVCVFCVSECGENFDQQEKLRKSSFSTDWQTTKKVEILIDHLTNSLFLIHGILHVITLSLKDTCAMDISSREIMDYTI
jgi:hypothetical protein